MLAALLVAAVFAAPGPRLDPQHLPPLPARGLVRELRSGVALETLRGRPLGWLRGLHLSRRPGEHGALFQDARGRTLVIDLFERRVRKVFALKVHAPQGCHFTDATTVRLFVCGRTIKSLTHGRVHVVVGPPNTEGGGWAWAEFSRPDGRLILAQWSGECESPTAYLIQGGEASPFGRTLESSVESFALGWLPHQRAVVYFPSGACGRGVPVPGVYVEPMRGRPDVLKRTPKAPPQLLAMWGG